MTRRRTALILSSVAAALMFVQALAGLLFRRAYTDGAWARGMELGNDLVTLLVATPLFVAATAAARRGSRRGLLAWLGMFGFGIYNYAYYLLGPELNVFFPLYAALVLIFAIGLILAVALVDAAELAVSFRPNTPVRLVGGFLAVVGAGLGAVWLASWWSIMNGGQGPAVGTTIFHLVAALDLTLMSSVLVAGGVLLWRRHPWGYVVASMAAVQAAVYLLVLTLGNVFVGSAGEIAFSAVLRTMTVIAAFLMLHDAEPAPVLHGA